MKRVLIVDDALDLGRMLKTALETLNAGLDVRVMPSAEEALLEVSRQPAVLMVADIRLPGMSGFELLKKVRRRSPETRFIMITGMTDTKLVHDAEAAGADRFMRKPIHVGEFLQTAQELLNQPLEPVKVPADAQSTDSDAPGLPGERLSGILGRLRVELGAQLVLMADDRGRVVAQAGELTNLDFENRWSPPVMAALSAASKVARVVHPGLPQASLSFRGEPYNLTLAPVGEFALAIFHSNDHSGLRTAIAQEVVFEAQKDLAGVLEGMDVRFYAPVETLMEKLPVHPAAAEAEEIEEMAALGEAEPKLDELAATLTKSSRRLVPERVEEFWKQALEGETQSTDEADGLSYDQAHQLGLTPGNE